MSIRWPQVKTLIVVLSGIVAAVVPAALGYMQNRDEIQARYQETQDAAIGGYAALAASVKDLQATVAAQHDYILKLDAHLEDIERFLVRSPREHPAPAPPAAPAALDLPRNFGDAAQKYAPKR